MSFLRKFILFSAVFILYANSAYGSAVFSDVASNHPNYEAISYLQENGIIEGYHDNTFRPQQPVNRAESLKIILLGSDIFVPEIQNQNIFPDVMHGSWYAKYVAKAKNMTIVSGDSDTGFFRPGDTVNLAEALKILLKTGEVETVDAGSPPFADVPQNVWFAPYFEYAKSVSLLDQNSSQNVYPATPVTRGLLAELMYRLSQRPKGYQEGQASYYGEKFHGKTTASGEVFDASQMTAAHRKLPFNTWMKVTNRDNGKSVVVRITDRGPYAGENRIIDLSKAAFEEIASLSSGIINVSIHPTSPPSKTNGAEKEEEHILEQTAEICPEKKEFKFFSENSFENIVLDETLPNQLIEGELFILSGKTTSDQNAVNAFIVDENEKQTTFSAPVNNMNFDSLKISFPNSGTFKFGIIPGNSGSSLIQEIIVLPTSCLNKKEDPALPLISNLSINIDEGNTVINWDRGDYSVISISFRQNGLKKEYFLYNSDNFLPPYKDFIEFTERITDVSIKGAYSDEKFLSNVEELIWSPEKAISFNATIHHEYINDESQIEIVSIPDFLTLNQPFEIVIKPKTNINSKGAIILPNGTVEKVLIKGSTQDPIKNSNGIDVFISGDNQLKLSYNVTDSNVHFAEINNAEGLAVINIPIYPQNEYPLLPNPSELSDYQPVDLGDNLSSLRNKMLELINSDRSKHGKSALSLDDKLNNLAQSRSDDMAGNDYFSHWNNEGMNANDIRKNYAISQVVTENIAKDITVELAEYGLMRSAMHRSNILTDEWILSGIGISKMDDGSYIFVQIFSENPINLTDLSTLRKSIADAINEDRNTSINLKENINNLAQEWSDKMVEDDFFDFSAPDGTLLVDNIRNEGINVSIGTYIVGNTSFEDAKRQITENTQIKESQWLNLGIGLVQDNYGIIKITLIYTE